MNRANQIAGFETDADDEHALGMRPVRQHLYAHENHADPNEHARNEGQQCGDGNETSGNVPERRRYDPGQQQRKKRSADRSDQQAQNVVKIERPRAFVAKLKIRAANEKQQRQFQELVRLRRVYVGDARREGDGRER